MRGDREDDGTALEAVDDPLSRISATSQPKSTKSSSGQDGLPGPRLRPLEASAGADEEKPSLDAPGGGAPEGAAVQPPRQRRIDREGGEPPSSFEIVAPAVIFVVVAICIAADFAGDVVRGESALHLTGMAVGTLLSMTGLVIMLRILKRSRARAQDLATALDHSRADATRWHDQAAQTLQGLGALIDKQFAEWGLSPSEREVAMLLLKGLSLKEIAAVRNSSEPTVRQQAQAVYRKADLTGRAELSAFFLEDLILPRNSPSSTSPAVTPAPARTSR
jgi:DNA-binding CsgD family transcriptional regulator